MDEIEDRYFGGNTEYGENLDLSDSSSSNEVSPSLTAYSFVGLFMVIGILSLLALAVSESHIWRKPISCSRRFLSWSSAKVNPSEEKGSTTRNADKEYSVDTQSIGSENGEDNRTLPV